MRRRRIGISVVAGIGMLAQAFASEPDAGKLIELLQASFNCPIPTSDVTSSNTTVIHHVLRYTGDTSVFRVEATKRTMSGIENVDSNYEIAFNFGEIASVKSVNNSVLFVCVR